jgi:hypothetical protein
MSHHSRAISGNSTKKQRFVLARIQRSQRLAERLRIARFIGQALPKTQA